MTFRDATRLVAVLALASAPRGAAAAPGEDATKEEARRRLREGNERLAAGDFAAALAKFRAAYAVYASPKVLVNVGTALRGLEQEVEAAEVYAQCLREGASLKPDERAAVEQALAEVRSHLGRLAVEVNEADATVLLDGLAIGTAPLDGARWIKAGPHRVEARKEGFHPSWETVEVVGGQAHAVKLLLARGSAAPVAPARKPEGRAASVPPAAPPVAVAAPPVATSRPRERAPAPIWRRPWAWGVGAAVVAGVAVAVFFAVRDDGDDAAAGGGGADGLAACPACPRVSLPSP